MMRPPLISTDILFTLLSDMWDLESLALVLHEPLYGVEHDLGPQSRVGRVGVLLRRVAYAVCARDENHRARYPVCDAHGVVGGTRVHRHVRLAAPLRGLFEGARHAPVERRRRQGLALGAVGGHAASPCGLLCERGDVTGDATEALLVHSSDIERELRLSGDGVDEVRPQLHLPDRPDRAPSGLTRELLELEHALGRDEASVLAEIHGRRPGVVAPSANGDVGVDVARNRVYDAYAVRRILEYAGLLDVELDPPHKVVEDVDRILPPARLVAGLLGVFPERAPVVHRAELLAQVLLAHPLGDDAAAEEHLTEPGALFLQERDELQRETEPQLLVQAADLERRDDAHRAVVLSAVAVRVAVGADAEDPLSRGSVPGDERADRVLVMLEAQALELAYKVGEGVAVLGRVGVAPDRLMGARVFRPGQGLDVALYALGALRPVYANRFRGQFCPLLSLRRRGPAVTLRARCRMFPRSPPSSPPTGGAGSGGAGPCARRGGWRRSGRDPAGRSPSRRTRRWNARPPRPRSGTRAPPASSTLGPPTFRPLRTARARRPSPPPRARRSPPLPTSAGASRRPRARRGTARRGDPRRPPRGPPCACRPGAGRPWARPRRPNQPARRGRSGKWPGSRCGSSGRTGPGGSRRSRRRPCRAPSPPRPPPPVWPREGSPGRRPPAAWGCAWRPSPRPAPRGPPRGPGQKTSPLWC